MTRPSPPVSVVVPTRDRAELLRDCLRSLRNQSYPADCYEIVVVDDGSRDRTPEVVAGFGRLGPPATMYVRVERRGLNAARNAGVAAAEGDPICFVDDDVDVPPAWLAAMAEGVERHPDGGCFVGPIRLRLEGRSPRMCGWERLGETELDLGASEIPTAVLYGTNMALRRSVLERVGGFDQRLSGTGDETEWQLRYQDSGGDIWYIPGAWLWHRRTACQLKFVALVRRRFRRGVQQARFLCMVGKPLNTGEAVLGVLRNLGHAAKRRCPIGCLAAASYMGRVWGALIAPGAGSRG